MSKNKHIMIIEDEKMLQRAIKEKLESAGMSTVSYTNGKAALEHFETSKKTPDLIWLDYYLQGPLNGLDFLITLKNNKKTANIPVIVVSNSASDTKIENMLSLGADKYMLKAAHRLDEIIHNIQELTV